MIVKAIQRFEQKIEKTDTCWIWKSATPDGRYGVFWYKGKNSYAHRLAYEFYKGPIPNGSFVCHQCDNGLCVNPSHLFLGTAKDNVQDCVNKNRRARQDGEHNPASILNIDDVIRIKALLDAGQLFQREIAIIFGVKRKCISDIKTGRIWKKVNLPITTTCETQNGT